MQDSEIIIQKVDALKELFEEKFSNNDEMHKVTNKHLETLNGQTAKNSQFRIRGNVYFRGLYLLLTVILIPTIYLIVDKLWQ